MRAKADGPAFARIHAAKNKKTGFQRDSAASPRTFWLLEQDLTLRPSD